MKVVGIVLALLTSVAGGSYSYGVLGEKVRQHDSVLVSRGATVDSVDVLENRVKNIEHDVQENQNDIQDIKTHQAVQTEILKRIEEKVTKDNDEPN